jgi:hypothetical protein
VVIRRPWPPAETAGSPNYQTQMKNTPEVRGRWLVLTRAFHANVDRGSPTWDGLNVSTQRDYL